MSETIVNTICATDGEPEFVEDAHTCPEGQFEPPWSTPPSAIAKGESAHTSTPAKSSLLIVSPSEVVKFLGRRAPSCPEDFNSEYLEEWVRWEALIRAGECAAAAEMCREKLLTAEGERKRLRWVKDLAISRLRAGRADCALDLISSHYPSVTNYEDTLRAKCECTIGRAYELTGRLDKALMHYDAARIFHEQNGNLIHAAEVDINLSECRLREGECADALRYVNRAIRAARRENDSRLLSEAHDTKGKIYLKLSGNSLLRQPTPTPKRMFR
jgi:tetratricopeptide (TPR) repeat protein